MQYSSTVLCFPISVMGEIVLNAELKQHSDIGVVSRDGVLCGTVGSVSKLVRVQAGWNVVFDVLENKLLKALHQYGGECHRPIVQTRHCRLFRYRHDRCVLK